MQVVVKHFLGRDLSLAELDKLTGRSPQEWTWTTQCVSVLHQMGLQVRYYTTAPLEPFLEGPPFLYRHFGQEIAAKMLQFSNWPVTEASIRRCLQLGLSSLAPVTFQDVESGMARGYVPMIMLDQNVLESVPGSYNGHFVVLTGYDDHHVYYHESGPANMQPHRCVPKQRIVDSWLAPGTDKDLVMVYGRYPTGNRSVTDR